MIIDIKAAAKEGARGLRVPIDDDRSVAMYPADPSGWEFRFTNGEAVTRLLLSDDAVGATLAMLLHWAESAEVKLGA